MSDRSPRSPYPGLRPFRDDEVVYFFGRERQVDEMIDGLAANRFLAVIGTSGCGKSSLVNCGLIPALHRGLLTGAGTNWRIARFRPGARPVHSLARCLSRKGLLFDDWESTLSLTDVVSSTLRLGRAGLVDIFQQSRLSDVNLLVIVDQFEEIFRYRVKGGRDDGALATEARELVNLLLESVRHSDVPIFVVITMRSDFLGDCTEFPELPETINAGQYLVPRMTRSERRLAIEAPARLVGTEVSPVLVTRLLNDVGDDPDQLSILQHALNRTFCHWQDTGAKGPLEVENYNAIGTVSRALNDHAEEVYSELSSDADRTACEKIFKALTDRVNDPRGVRRPTTFAALCEITGYGADCIQRVIDGFRESNRSFLMPPQGEALSDDVVVDISHESLMRIWKRLDDWTVEESGSAELYQRLSRDAALHGEGSRSLWRGPELAMGVRWQRENLPTEAWAERYGSEFDQAMRFLKRSRAAALWRTLGAATAVLIVFAALIAFARSKSIQAEAQLLLAKAAENKRELAIGEALLAENRRELALEKAQRAAKEVEDLKKENHKLEGEVKAFLERNPKMRADVQELRKEIRVLIVQLLETREENLVLIDQNERNADGRDQLESTIDLLSNEIKNLNATKAETVGELNLLRDEQTALEQEVAEERTKLGPLEEANGRLRAELLAKGFLTPSPPKMNVGTASQEPDWGYGTAGGGHVKETLGTSPTENLNRKIRQLEDRLLAFKDEAKLLEMLKDELSERKQQLEQELAGAKEENANLKAKRDALRAEIKKLGDRASTLRLEKSKLVEEVTKLQKKTMELRAANDRLTLEKQELSRFTAFLQEENKVMEKALEPGPAKPVPTPIPRPVPAPGP